MAAQANVALGITAQNSTAAAFRGARQNVQGLRQSVDGMGGSVLRNRRLVQQFGMQVSDLSVQIAGGQSAILALTQQVPQFVQGFGAMGGVLAALITIVGTVALVMTKTGKGLSDITPIAGVLRQEVEWLVMAFAAVGDAVVWMANLVVNNLDRIAITLSVVVGLFLGKWVAAMAIAAAGAFTLSGALLFLRAALIRTGIGAAIVVVGELIYQFMRLTEAVGGVGKAAGMVADVFIEMAQRISMIFEGLKQVYAAASAFLVSVFLEAINKVIGGFMELTWQIADGMNTLFKTNTFSGAMLGEVTQELGRASVAADDYARKMAGAAVANFEGAAAPLKSVKAIKDALAGLTDDSQIDVRDWFGGVEEAAGGAGGAIDKAAKSVETFQQSVAKTLISGLDRLFDSMFEGGKKAVEALRDIGKELLKMVAKQSFYNILAKLLPSTFGAGGFLDLGAAGSLKPYAKGGIVNAPTAFPMRGGKTGLMGEAGPEAILPLTRGANGALGVAAAGGGGGGAVQVNVITPPGSSVEQSERQGAGGVTIRDIVIKEMQSGVASGQMDRVNRQRYNMAPVPAKR